MKLSVVVNLCLGAGRVRAMATANHRSGIFCRGSIPTNRSAGVIGRGWFLASHRSRYIRRGGYDGAHWLLRARRCSAPANHSAAFRCCLVQCRWHRHAVHSHVCQQLPARGKIYFPLYCQFDARITKTL